MPNGMEHGDKESECLKYICEHWNVVENLQATKAERAAIENVVFSAEPNPKKSEFPDFISDDGFIEHFEVSGSKENRKGSEHRKMTSYFQKECKERFSKIEPPDCINNLQIKTYEMNGPQYTHEDFIKSFQKHFESHISSMKKYDGHPEFRVFLIENTAATFMVMKDQVYAGKLYRLSFDKDLLNYLLLYQEDITHIIYRSAQYIEVVSLKQIPELLKNLPEGISFEGGRYKNICQQIVIDMQ